MNKIIKAYCPICNKKQDYFIIGKNKKIGSTTIMCSKCNSIKNMNIMLTKEQNQENYFSINSIMYNKVFLEELSKEKEQISKMKK
mgnify:CR=1 FL=1